MRIHTGLIVACLMTLAAPAGAQDRKAYHGAGCYMYASHTTGYVSPIYGIFNSNSTGTLEVICPLVRDRINSSTSLYTTYVEGFNASGSYLCQMNSQAEDSSAGTTIDFDQNSTSNTGIIQVGLSVDTSNGDEGSFAVSCYLTPNSYLYHVQVSENTSATE